MEGHSHRFTDRLTRLLVDCGGLIGVKSKVKIPDKNYLGLVYTPGVGAVCLDIKADPKRATHLTNKTNSCLIMTDGSGFDGFSQLEWVQEQAIPFIETRSLFYKVFSGIDAFPILADSKLINNGFDILELLDNLTPSYNAVQLYRMNWDRLREVKELYQQKPFDLFIWTDLETDVVKQTLAELQLESLVYDKLVSGTVIRIALDNQISGFIDHSLIKSALQLLTTRVSPQTAELEVIEALVVSFLEVWVKDSSRSLRDTLEFVKDNFLYKVERRPVDDHDYTNTARDTSAIYVHERYKGMFESQPKLQISSFRSFRETFADDKLTKVRQLLAEDPEAADIITLRRNYSAIATNGTAILGLGNIGALAGIPVMEGKSVLFTLLGSVNVIPLSIREQNPDKFISIMRRLAPIFTSINLEDIKAPDCFKIEDSLKATCRPAVFHDDQHGTAIVVSAAILSYCRLTKRDICSLKVVINGGGAAGNSICKLIKNAGVQHIIMCDTKGAIFKGRTHNMNEQKEQIAEWTNAERFEGGLAEAVKGRDVFIGVSAAGALSKAMVATMNEKCFVMALANPEPEIYPTDALAAGALVASTGRSDFPNQVNNSLAFPGLFRGVKRFRVSQISEAIKIAAAQALSHLIPDSELTSEYVIPQALNPEIPKIIAKIVGEVGLREGLVRPEPKNRFDTRDPEELWY